MWAADRQVLKTRIRVKNTFTLSNQNSERKKKYKKAKKTNTKRLPNAEVIFVRNKEKVKRV